jgi:thermostable 8-oxoguanine DNA glycosylase
VGLDGQIIKEKERNMPDVIRDYRSTDDAIKREGALWYFEAAQVAAELGKAYEKTALQGAAVISALSPRNHWETNIKQAAEYLKAAKEGQKRPKASTYGIQQRKAWEIALLDDIQAQDTELIYRMLGTDAYKTKAFYRNITDPFESQDVTIDVWILRYLGKSDVNMTPKRYRTWSAIFRNAAEKIGILPHQLQATIWLSIRK